MRISPEHFDTRADCDVAIDALIQRRKDLEGEREFRIEERLCVGSADHPYYRKESQAMTALRRELRQGGADPSFVNAASYEELNQALGSGRGRFDVTRQGCEQSLLFVTPYLGHHKDVPSGRKPLAALVLFDSYEDADVNGDGYGGYIDEWNSGAATRVINGEAIEYHATVPLDFPKRIPGKVVAIVDPSEAGTPLPEAEYFRLGVQDAQQGRGQGRVVPKDMVKTYQEGYDSFPSTGGSKGSPFISINTDGNLVALAWSKARAGDLSVGVAPVAVVQLDPGQELRFPASPDVRPVPYTHDELVDGALGLKRLDPVRSAS